MNKFRLLLSVAGILAFNALHAQDIRWDRDLYPDYNPTPRIDKAQQAQMAKRIKRQAAAGKTRPDHWNNALSNAFPPVMNQSAGSCGSASRIYYMFAHEMNAARWADGSKTENIYPTHFTWLLTWTPNQGKEIIAQYNGVPNSDVYGGYTFSEYFGYQDCDTKDSNYGWMQGYDKWFNAMNNRISGTANFPAVNTEEGREIVKNYLWNHCGDETYSTGGIVGVGVAMSPTTTKIPKTTTNDAIGVTGMKYVTKWGTSVNHALTIVGYDDRIEFDLDGNGVKGEKDKDEVGAWIIVNSWGSGWENQGFVYCPYAEARPTATATDYWGPEYYTPRRNYRPLRTLKVTMDYDHRSEIALYVGVSKDLNATAPEQETWLRHFYYSGLGKGVTVNASNPDPEIPMLGRWADGALHTEPMEFGYDLTDLVSDYESGQPLKYFFRVETRAWAAGAGTIHSASIIDYTVDREGVETPFEVNEGGIAIANAGKNTTITTIARGDNIPSPRNLSVKDGVLQWQEPVAAPYTIITYNIYKDGKLLNSVDGQDLTAEIDGAGAYTVSAVYQANGNETESKKSAAVIATSDEENYDNNFIRFTKNGSFTVKEFSRQALSEYTIEFLLRPGSSSSDYCGMKASSGKFFLKLNKNRCIELGFDGGDYTTCTTALNTTSFSHVAVVVKDNNMKVYINGVQRVNWNSGYNNSGLSGANDLYVGKTEGTSSNYKQLIDAPMNGYLDELRIWNYARSATEIKNTYTDSYIYPLLQAKLTHYYKMDTRTEDETTYLIDAMGQHDAAIATDAEFTTYSLEASNKANPIKPTASADFSLSASNVSVGTPVQITDLSSPSTTQWEWTFTGAEEEKLTCNAPVVAFNAAGEQTITLKSTNVNGIVSEKSKTITVTAAEKPVADFKIPEGPYAAGDHISFINTSTPIDGATYSWTLEGAEVEKLNTVNAAATYGTFGKYTVKLEAKNATGVSSIEKEIEIVKVAPLAGFNLQNSIAIVGEKINLIDNSKYNPEQWEWMIANKNNTYFVNVQSGSVELDKPGVYNVTLTASNDIGSSQATRQRAITVCNADGETGLNFDAVDDEVVAPSPFSGRQGNLTVEWWMYPGSITGTSCKIGDSDKTFMLTVGEDLAMTVYAKSRSVKSLEGYIVENEWHHYAVTHSTGGVVTFYRDGVQYGSTATLAYNSSKWNNLCIGGSDAPMNAILDELRLWTKILTIDEIRQYANAPIEDPQNTNGLRLYYDFNQSSGDVIDRSANVFNGIRNNFGPDGDAWTNSKGIFFLEFNSSAANVTATYLKNYMAPFTTGTGFVNGTSRFKKLGAPWIQENSIHENGITTEFHVDANKSNQLTLSTEWDGFASEVSNLKLYQVVELPAGAYEFGALNTRSSEWYPGVNFLVVAVGEGLPDYTNLSTEALGYARCDRSCTFVLKEPTKVSIGLLSNQSGKACTTIQMFGLMRSEVEVIEAGELFDGIDDINNEVHVIPGIQAIGGLGIIKVTVEHPQQVDIYDLAGKLIWSEFVVRNASIPARRGLYIVSRQKVMVR